MCCVAGDGKSQVWTNNTLAAAAEHSDSGRLCLRSWPSVSLLRLRQLNVSSLMSIHRRIKQAIRQERRRQPVSRWCNTVWIRCTFTHVTLLLQHVSWSRNTRAYLWLEGWWGGAASLREGLEETGGPLLPLHSPGPGLAFHQQHHQVQDVWPPRQMER